MRKIHVNMIDHDLFDFITIGRRWGVQSFRQKLLHFT